MNYWWVNQNQTYKSEVGGGFLWSPQRRKDGARNQFYENMTLVRPGDILFSFCDTRIKALGIATSQAIAAAKPDFGNAGANWNTEGWLVEVEFEELNDPVRPKDHIETLRPLLEEKYAPLQPNGDGKQAVYLAHVSQPLADALIQLIGRRFSEAISQISARTWPDEDREELREVKTLQERTDIGPTEKLQLTKARLGQGIFKNNVRLHEDKCRVTMIADKEHLRASHIKPWSKSNDQEKLDGANGLLLAPHIDHLFDRGFITFSEAGKLVLSPHLSSATASAWGLTNGQDVGNFTERQQAYLAHHRQQVFKKD